MKSPKIICFLLALCLSLTLCACGSTSVPSTPSSTPSDNIEAESETTKPEITPDTTEPDNSTNSENTEAEVTDPEVTDNVESNEEEKLVPPVETTEEPPEPVKPEPEHKHEYSSKVVAPTCDKDGYTQYTCSCGDAYKDSTVKATGHSYTDKTVAPTTSEKGYTLHTCSKCGSSYKDNYVDKLPTEQKPADGGYTVVSQKVGTSSVDVQDVNNLLSDGEGGYSYTISRAPVGTVLVHDALEQVGSPAENLDHFAKVMQEIDITLDIEGKEWYSYGSSGGEYYIKNDKYVMYDWGFSGGGKFDRNLMLNAMMYFGGDSMGKAVWSMVVDYYDFTGWDEEEHSAPISSELAAKYGLTIQEYKAPSEGSSQHRAYVSNGSETWEIWYNGPNSDGIGDLWVYIPA